MRRHLRVLQGNVSATPAAPGSVVYTPPNDGRPIVRDECRAGPRPCPWVSCEHHLAIEVKEQDHGPPSLRILFPDGEGGVDLEAMPETCWLDVAERGEHTLEQIGTFLNVTRERVRQVELGGLRNMLEHLAALGIDVPRRLLEAARRSTIVAALGLRGGAHPPRQLPPIPATPPPARARRLPGKV